MRKKAAPSIFCIDDTGRKQIRYYTLPFYRFKTVQYSNFTPEANACRGLILRTSRTQTQHPSAMIRCTLDYLLCSSHSVRTASGRCVTEKSEKVTLKPFPSGLAPIIPTLTGRLASIQALRIMVYSLSSNE